MKKTLLFIMLLIPIILTTSYNKGEADVRGIYQWSDDSGGLNGTYVKSILVSENEKGGITITLKDKCVSGPDDLDCVIGNKLNTELVLDSGVKYGQRITAYSVTDQNRCKHELIFQKTSVKWRYSIEESNTADTAAKKADKMNKKDRKYIKLEKYKAG